MLTPNSDHPIDPTTISIVREILQAANALGILVFLVGATARIILLGHVFGLNPGRATRDVDFAFAVKDWEQFEAIKNQLLATNQFIQSDRAAQRLYFLVPNMQHEYIVDLIPFGDIERKPNTIAWPPDMSVIMNVAGYADAMDAAVKVEIAPGVVIPIASIPGIAILKLFAWHDRGYEDPKDALDFVTILRSYNEADNLDRIYEDAISALEAVNHDVELAGAWLLGSDTYSISSALTRAGLASILTQPAKRQRLVEDMARALRGRDDAMTFADTILSQFESGFRE